MYQVAKSIRSNPLLLMLLFAVVGTALLVLVFAGVKDRGIEAEGAQLSGATRETDPNASGQQFIQFGGSTGGGNNGNPITSNEEAVAFIKAASATATSIRAQDPEADWNPQDFPVVTQYEYTPSSQLDYRDFVTFPGRSQTQFPAGGDQGIFHEVCQFSHLAYDDPLSHRFPDQ